MREMSSEMATLLKSKKMIGDNRAVHEVILSSGSSGNIQLTDLVDVIQGENYISDSSYSNYVLTNDGRFMEVGINDLNELIVGYTPDERFFNQHYPWTESLLYPSINEGSNILIPLSCPTNHIDGQFTSLFKRDDGKVLAFISDIGSITTESRTFCLISNSGNGDDFIFYSYVLRVPQLPDSSASNNAETNIPIQIDLGNGNKRLILNFANYYWYSSDIKRYLTTYIYSSDDGGLNWVQRASFGKGWGFTLPHSLGQIAQLKSGELYFELLYSSTQSYLMGSYDDGVTWDYLSDGSEYQDNFGDTNIAYSSFGSYYMDVDSDVLYRTGFDPDKYLLCIYCIKNPTDAKLKNNKNWILMAEILLSQEGSCKKFIKMPSGMIAASSDKNNGTVIIGFMITKLTLQAKKISINKNNGMSSNLNIEFDNKDGILAPDKEGTYFQVLWPNKEIVVRQGYGNELIQTYKGLIDTVDMETFPQSIRVSARDNLKRALDQTISTILGEHVLTFVGMQVEDMFTSLAGMAGIQLGVVEETGIAVAEKTFSWESYGDAFSWLSELVGFEVVCDEEGLTHFRKQQIPTIPDISYEFVEGEDIVSLGYTINDTDLYRDIIVHGKNGDDVIEFKKVFSAADYWGILPQKLLKIDAPEATSLAECEAIALKAEYLMISRARIVRFQSIGIPHLQVGDFIRVTESSTTISEVYRITDLSTNQDSDTYTMDITCHWYSAGGVV